MGPVRGRPLGFTLIELMLAAAIIGLLAGIGIPKFGNLLDKAREASLKANIGAIRSALSIYYADTEGFYPRVNAMPPAKYGLFHLHNKYVDLNRIRFTLPRYARKGLFAGFPSSYSAMELYGPPVTIYQHEYSTPDIVHAASPFPSYFAYAVSSAQPIIYVHFGNCVYLVDTKGVYWSEW